MIASMAVLVNSPGWGYDFEAYYLAALRQLRGDGIYLPWTLAEPFRPGPYLLYLYAPPLAVAVAPFTVLSLPAATAVWVGLRIGLLALACGLMPVSRFVRLGIFASATFSNAVLSDLHLGNVSVVVAFLSALAWRWLDRPAGAIPLALAMSVRPTMGLVLIWSLLRRRFTFILWTIIAGLALIAMTLPIVGFVGYQDYLRVLSNVSDVTGVPNNLDLGSTVLRLGLGPVAATIALFTGYAIGIGSMFVAVRRGDRDMGYVVTLGASLLLAPLLWDHYLVSLIIPGAFLAQRGMRWGLLLPLATWASPAVFPFVVVASTVLPLFARTVRIRDDATPTRSGSEGFEADQIADGGAATGDPAGGELDDAVGVRHRGDDAAPRRKRRADLDDGRHAFRRNRAHEQRVDREAHEEHVDARRSQVERLAVSQA